MSELNIIYPLCCFTGNYCSYNTGFIDGYTIGIITLCFIVIIIELMFCLKAVSKQINIDESEEKSEYQKKDD